jgi:aurora kinase
MKNLGKFFRKSANDGHAIKSNEGLNKSKSDLSPKSELRDVVAKCFTKTESFDNLQTIQAHPKFRADIFSFWKSLDHVVIGEHISGIPFKTAPKSLNEFQVSKKLANQTYCKVYKALHVDTNMIVVLKIYFRFPNYLLYSIEREIEVQLSLNHKNIVKLYSSFIQHDMIVLVQEYVKIQDLYIYQVKKGKLSEQECKMFARDILEGIDYIHSKCIAHRDIKPHNLFVDDNLTIKIGDFGSCINTSIENAVSCVGTTEYLAPEVKICPLKNHVTDNRNREDLFYTYKCDLWSFGITLFQLLTGVAPYHPIVYPSFLSGEAISFLRLVLKLNPEKRMNAIDLLNHIWLQEVLTP